MNFIDFRTILETSPAEAKETVLDLEGETDYFFGNVEFVTETPIGFVSIGNDDEGDFIRVSEDHPSDFDFETQDIARCKGKRSVRELAEHREDVRIFAVPGKDGAAPREPSKPYIQTVSARMQIQ